MRTRYPEEVFFVITTQFFCGLSVSICISTQAVVCLQKTIFFFANLSCFPPLYVGLKLARFCAEAKYVICTTTNGKQKKSHDNIIIIQDVRKLLSKKVKWSRNVIKNPDKKTRVSSMSHESLESATSTLFKLTFVRLVSLDELRWLSHELCMHACMMN